MKELYLPNQSEIVQINENRKSVAENMHQSGGQGAQLMGVVGPCSADGNRMPDGTLAHVRHGIRMAATAAAAESILFVVRDDGEKPRSNNGMTGLIHKPGGAQVYAEGARAFHAAGVPIAAEIVSDAGAAIMLPHLTIARIGAREASATAPRYAVRPTKQDIDNGIHPVPVLIKSGQDGNLKHTINAIRTIRSDEAESRVRFGHTGMEEVETVGNPHVGVILRGNDIRPQGELIEVLRGEAAEARKALDEAFGENVISLHVDTSHAYAKYGHENGGEPGQLEMAGAIGELILSGAPLDGWTSETYLLPEKQPEGGTIPGLSHTDRCIREELAAQLIADMSSVWAMRPPENTLITV